MRGAIQAGAGFGFENALGPPGHPVVRALSPLSAVEGSGKLDGMQYTLTPAAERALSRAAERIDRSGCLDLAGAALVAGLLQDDECRGSLLLRRAGITEASILQRWPNLADRPIRSAQPDTPPTQPEQTILLSLLAEPLTATLQRFADSAQATQLTTERMLWGLVADPGDVGRWLREQGVDADSLGMEIDALHHRHGENTVPDALGQQEAAKPIAVPEPSEQTDRPVAILRIVDASANRAREALRVIEDFVRFAMDDPHLTDCCKRLRHAMTGALTQIPLSQLLAARETQADVGTTLSVASERRRATDEELLGANFGRLQEALRSLEEFGKRLDPDLGVRFEQVRYQVYTLQRAVLLGHRAAQRLADARLYVLIDGHNSESEFSRRAEALVGCGAHVLQLRDKRLDDRPLLDRARRLRALTRGTPTLFIMNDRPDLAVLAEADGVHVGQEELTVKDARTIVGPDRLVGVSTHSIEQASQAVLDGADYLGVGPTFSSGTKQFEHFPGLDLVRAVAAEISLPAFAIGGICLDNLSRVLETGIGRVAVSGAVCAAEDPAASARQLLARLQAVRPT